MSTPITSHKPTRLLSLDALRGFDMFWIMSGEHIVHALAKATGWTAIQAASDQLHHTDWNGFTFYDMIFPLFIFIAGVSIPLAMQKKLEQAGVSRVCQLPGKDKKAIYGKLIRRTLILIALGMVVNGALKFNGLENTRFPSVLGRIGLACFFAAVIYYNNTLKQQIAWFALLLLGYWAAMVWIPVPGYGPGVLTMAGSLESYVDRLLVPGKLHDTGLHDPEGLLSTIPAIATALLGVFTGTWFQSTKHSMPQKGWLLLAAGALLVVTGACWGLVFPINKRLWTSSFTLYAGGYSVILTAIFYLIIDVAGYQKWAFPLVVIGVNSILIYIASEGMVNFSATANFVFGGMIHLLPETWQLVFAALSVTVVQWLMLYLLYRKKIFLKV